MSVKWWSWGGYKEFKRDRNGSLFSQNEFVFLCLDYRGQWNSTKGLSTKKKMAMVQW